MFINIVNFKSERQLNIVPSDGMKNIIILVFTAVLLFFGLQYLICCKHKYRKNRYDFDVIIRNGTIYDGSTKDPYIADIGIKNKKITAIGNLSNETAFKNINAAGLIVAPGFIDVHTHCDLVFIQAGWKRIFAHCLDEWKGNYNYITQGVTTVVTQNCGYGFTNINKWFRIIKSVGFGTNTYGLIAHGDIRNELFGTDNPKPLNEVQLELLKKRVEKEMQRGALGLGTGLEYAPGCEATIDELVELCKIVKKYGGIYVSHIRDLTGRIYEDGEPGVLKAVKEAIKIGEMAQIPVHLSHIQINEPINGLPASKILELIDNARKEGLDITADAYPYNVGITWITMLTPPEYKTSSSIKPEYKTREGKEELKRAVEKTFTYLSPDRVTVVQYTANKSYIGKTLKQIADMENRQPSEVYVELACDPNAPMCFFCDQDMQVVEALMQRDYVFTASDGFTYVKGSFKPHPRMFATFTKKIKKYALDDKLITLKDAIRSMTSLPAQKFNILLRGKIEIGFYADVVVFNQDTIKDIATYEDEDARYSEGIEYLLINGVVSIDKGKITGKRGGIALRRTSS